MQTDHLSPASLRRSVRAQRYKLFISKDRVVADTFFKGYIIPEPYRWPYR
ncbi:MAG: hypothetical protein WCK34_08990 [Bacteroidota bacterium]